MMRISIHTKTVFVAAVALLFVSAMPAQAQQSRGTRNGKISTIGEMPRSKLSSNIRSSFALNFSKSGGLFAGSESLVQSGPRPYIFALPGLGAAGYDFTGKTFDEYMNAVAGIYKFADPDMYLDYFAVQNVVSIQGELLLFESTRMSDHYYRELAILHQAILNIHGVEHESELDVDDREEYDELMEQRRINLILDNEPYAPRAVHEEDFMAAGGFLPVSPIDDTVGGVTPIPPVIEPIPPTHSGFSRAPQVASVIPEPGTFALMALGGAGVLARVRRR